MDEKLVEAVAACMWRQEAVRVAPNVVRLRTPEAFAAEADETRHRWLDQARAVLPIAMEHAAGIAVSAVVEEAEQACRYMAKHNYDHQEEGPYRDGFQTACELCEGAIGRHVDRHKDRIASAIRAAGQP